MLLRPAPGCAPAVRSSALRADRRRPASIANVLRLLARGNSNKQIAGALHISDATVHTHLINVYGKIGVRTRAGATLFALEHDLVQISSS